MTRPSRTLAPPNPDADPALQDDGPAHPDTGPALLAAGSAHAAPPGTAPPRREGGAGLLVARQPRQQAPASRGCVRGWDPRKGSARGPEVSSRLSASSARGQKRNSLKPLDQRLLATAGPGCRRQRPRGRDAGARGGPEKGRPRRSAPGGRPRQSPPGRARPHRRRGGRPCPTRAPGGGPSRGPRCARTCCSASSRRPRREAGSAPCGCATSACGPRPSRSSSSSRSPRAPPSGWSCSCRRS